MQKSPEAEDELLDQIERLVSELTAIRRWDREKWGGAKYPGSDEILSRRARRMRYDEILFDLFKIVSRLERLKNAQPQMGNH
jgi:hypothetical protein